MNFFWTHVPLSGWTVGATVVGTAVSIVTFRPLARWRSWQPVPTLSMQLLLVGVLALTVTPDGHRPSLGLAACIPVDWNDLVYNLTQDGGGLGGFLLNVLLFLPLTASVVFTTGRVWPGVAVSLLSPVIELVQTVLPGRSCGLSDLETNLVGVLLGVAVGWLIKRGGISGGIKRGGAWLRSAARAGPSARSGRR